MHNQGYILQSCQCSELAMLHWHQRMDTAMLHPCVHLNRYNYLHNPIPNGIVVPPSDYKIRVTNIERTVLDCIDRIDLCGGVEELIHSLTSVQYVDSHLLADYLKAYGKVALYKKAGYIFTLLKEFLQLPEEILSICHDQGSRSTTALTTVEPCTSYIKEWKP